MRLQVASSRHDAASSRQQQRQQQQQQYQAQRSSSSSTRRNHSNSSSNILPTPQPHVEEARFVASEFLQELLRELLGLDDVAEGIVVFFAIAGVSFAWDPQPLPLLLSLLILLLLLLLLLLILLGFCYCWQHQLLLILLLLPLQQPRPQPPTAATTTNTAAAADAGCLMLPISPWQAHRARHRSDVSLHFLQSELPQSPCDAVTAVGGVGVQVQ